jgi:hypothetical protein
MRYATYDVELDRAAKRYADLSAVREWAAAARSEPGTIEAFEYT